jgi:hypothetical protein
VPGSFVVNLNSSGTMVLEKIFKDDIIAEIRPF